MAGNGGEASAPWAPATSSTNSGYGRPQKSSSMQASRLRTADRREPACTGWTQHSPSPEECVGVSHMCRAVGLCKGSILVTTIVGDRKPRSKLNYQDPYSLPPPQPQRQGLPRPRAPSSHQSTKLHKMTWHLQYIIFGKRS